MKTVIHTSAAGLLSATEVASLLDEMAKRLELANVSKFKERAYENAANSRRLKPSTCRDRDCSFITSVAD
jgi:hypothetical protein